MELETNNLENKMDWMKEMVSRLVENTQTTEVIYNCSTEKAFEMTLNESTAGKKAIENARKELGI